MEGLSSEISEFPSQSIYNLWTVPAADTKRVDICFYYNYLKNSSPVTDQSVTDQSS